MAVPAGLPRPVLGALLAVLVPVRTFWESNRLGADGDSRPDECTWLHVELVLHCPPFHTVTNSGDEARGSGEQGLPRLAVGATGRGQGGAPGTEGQGNRAGGSLAGRATGPEDGSPNP